MKKLVGILMITMGLISLTACQDKEEAELLESSKEFAKDFMMEKENVEMVVQEAEFTPAIGIPTIFVRGYVEGDKSDRITVMVDYDKDGNLSSDSWGRGEGEVETNALEEYINK